jgi:hypothetical protein
MVALWLGLVMDLRNRSLSTYQVVLEMLAYAREFVDKINTSAGEHVLWSYSAVKKNRRTADGAGG